MSGFACCRDLWRGQDRWIPKIENPRDNNVPLRAGRRSGRIPLNRFEENARDVPAVGNFIINPIHAVSKIKGRRRIAL